MYKSNSNHLTELPFFSVNPMGIMCFSVVCSSVHLSSTGLIHRPLGTEPKKVEESFFSHFYNFCLWIFLKLLFFCSHIFFSFCSIEDCNQGFMHSGHVLYVFPRRFFLTIGDIHKEALHLSQANFLYNNAQRIGKHVSLWFVCFVFCEETACLYLRHKSYLIFFLNGFILVYV